MRRAFRRMTSDQLKRVIPRLPARIASSRRFSRMTQSEADLRRSEQSLVLDLPIELAEMAEVLPVEVRDADQLAAGSDDMELGFRHRDAEAIALHACDRFAG